MLPFVTIEDLSKTFIQITGLWLRVGNLLTRDPLSPPPQHEIEHEGKTRGLGHVGDAEGDIKNLADVDVPWWIS
jgi:hypothetical protein